MKMILIKNKEYLQKQEKIPEGTCIQNYYKFYVKDYPNLGPFCV